MKKVSPLLLLIFSFSLFAQDDDYCPCQDEQIQEAEIFEYFSSVNSQIAVFVPQENYFDPIPETLQESEPVAILFQKIEKEEEQEKDVPDIDSEEVTEKMEARMDSRKSQFKKLKKRKKNRVKRKKKAKKYKGKCPFF